MEHLTTNLVTIAVETAAVILLVWLLSWIACRALRLLTARTSAEGAAGGADRLAKALRRFLFLGERVGTVPGTTSTRTRVRDRVGTGA